MQPPRPGLMKTYDSEAVWQAGYDAPAQVFYVRFSEGDLYAYREVPAEVVQKFEAAPSKGRAFNETVYGIYPYEKVEG